MTDSIESTPPRSTAVAERNEAKDHSTAAEEARSESSSGGPEESAAAFGGDDIRHAVADPNPDSTENPVTVPNDADRTSPPCAEPADAGQPTTHSLLLPQSRVLHEAHAKYLLARGVPVELALAVGLASATAVEVSRALALSIALTIGGLLIPYRYRDGQLPYLRVRLDEELDDGSRFLVPAGLEVPIYIAGEGVFDTNKPLYVVEGPIKALALEAFGFAAVGLGGVNTTLAATSSNPAPTLGGSWGRVPLKGRDVRIVFDAGRTTNPAVAKAEDRLGRALLAAGATVSFVRLPLRHDGSDQGPDDYLAVHGLEAFRSLDAAAVPADPLLRINTAIVGGEESVLNLLADRPFLLQLASATPGTIDVAGKRMKKSGVSIKTLRNAIGGAKSWHDAHVRERMGVSGAHGFSRRGGGLWNTRTLGDEVKVEQISNFAPRVVRAVTLIRGELPVTNRLELDVEFEQGGPTAIAIDADRFQQPNWVIGELGPRAVVVGGPRNHSGFIEAVLRTSDPEHAYAYAETGFRKMSDGRRAFLHAGGAIGASRIVSEYDSFLRKYRFPTVVAPADTVGSAVRHVLSFLGVADTTISLSLLAFAIRCLLAEIAEVPVVVFVVGRTGLKKSSLVAALMRLFGPKWSDRDFLGFNNTSNFLEHVLHVAACVPTVVDDFVVNGNTKHAGDLQAKVERLIRDSANTAARGRCTSDGGTRPMAEPRGGVIITGEHSPPGHSLVGRCIMATVGEDTVRTGALNDWLGHPESPSIAIAAFIGDFLLPNYEQIRDTMPGKVTELRDSEFTGMNAHPRTPTSLANLLYAFRLFLVYAKSIGAIDDAEVAGLRATASSALRRLGEAQNSHVTDADPTTIFVSVLASLISQGKALYWVHGLDPQNSAASPLLAWMDPRRANIIVIDAHAAFTMVNRELISGQRGPIPNLRALKEQLIAKKWALPGQADRLDRTQAKTPHGNTVDAIRLRKDVLFDGGVADEVGAGVPLKIDEWDHAEAVAPASNDEANDDAK